MEVTRCLRSGDRAPPMKKIARESASSSSTFSGSPPSAGTLYSSLESFHAAPPGSQRK
jgi:hypothetical protein